MKIEINNRKKFGKGKNSWKINNILLNNQWVTEEIKEEILKFRKVNDNDGPTSQNLVHN